MTMQSELKEVERLRGLLTDPRERISSQAHADLERMMGSSYANVLYAVEATLGNYNGTLSAFVDQVLVPQLVQSTRAALEGKKKTEEVVADVGEVFRASGSLRVWGILAAMAGSTQLDEAVRKEAERYALEGYSRKY